MVKPRSGLFLLMGICTALLATSCGIEYKIGLVVAAAASASTVSANGVGARSRSGAATCVDGSDQPHCNDPSYDLESDAEGAPRSRMEGGAKKRSRKERSSKDGVNKPTNTSKESSSKEPDDGGTVAGKRTKFQNGDIIELYNADSSDIQIVFPSIVKGRDPAPDDVAAATAAAGGPEQHFYRVTKTTDGREVSNLPERFLHRYVPYGVGDEALCNIGEFRKSRPIIVRCTILGYEAAAARGAMVLQGKYQVQVHATKANEDYATSLPVWKLQRRYLAGPKVAAATS